MFGAVTHEYRMLPTILKAQPTGRLWPAERGSRIDWIMYIILWNERRNLHVASNFGYGRCWRSARLERAYFTYPVADGLLEAATIFAAAARAEGLELVVNNSQFQGTPGDPAFRDLKHAPSFRNLQHRLADRIFDWAQVGAVHVQAPPYYENVRALVRRSVAEQNTAFLPWGEDKTVIPLAGAEDVARVAAALLANPGLPSQGVYALLTETLTVGEMIDALGRAVGRPIRYVPITDEQWANAVKERVSPHALDHLSHLWQYFRRGEERYQPTDAIRAVTGRDPQRLEEFFNANAKAISTGQQ